MRKTFQLAVEGKNPDRLLEAIKHEIGKYLKRERRRDLPEGVDFWDFACRFGTGDADAKAVHLAELKGLMDGVKAAGGTQFYVEILAKHGVRSAKPQVTDQGDF
jgi:hypothetical protein